MWAGTKGPHVASKRHANPPARRCTHCRTDCASGVCKQGLPGWPQPTCIRRLAARVFLATTRDGRVQLASDFRSRIDRLGLDPREHSGQCSASIGQRPGPHCRIRHRLGDLAARAYADETSEEVDVHVLVTSIPGTYPAMGFVRTLTIPLKAPLGGRRVVAAPGASVPIAGIGGAPTSPSAPTSGH